MAKTDANLQMALARAVASRKVPDNVVAKIAKKISTSKLPIKGIDICVYGICIDYVIDDEKWWKFVPDLMAIPESRIRGLRVFPWGIPAPDVFHVQIEHEFEELGPYLEGPARG